MYTAYNMKIKLEDMDDYRKYIESGKQRLKCLKENVEQEIENFTLSDDTINGTILSDSWFERVKSDIFISHSHMDSDIALALTGWLEKTFSLKVFTDEIVWNSADKLLKKIDKKFCWQDESKTYNYSKRNITTSHVHAMLINAIYSVMDETEVVLFINTQNSVPNIKTVIEEDSKYTLSPWIFQELQATQLLRTRNWTEYREKEVIAHSQFLNENSELKIAYKIPLNNLTEIDGSILNDWEKEYMASQNKPYGNLFSDFSNHPLNYLYKIANGEI